jgi:hypothetical protein
VGAFDERRERVVADATLGHPIGERGPALSDGRFVWRVAVRCPAHVVLGVFLCGPAVTTVEIERRHGVRNADVSAGPGWLAVLWTPDDRAVVRAYTADRRQTFLWASPNEAT